MSTFCNSWCRNIALSNIIKNKENFTHQETLRQIREHEISGKENVNPEKFRFKVKDKVEDFFSGEESRFIHGR